MTRHGCDKTEGQIARPEVDPAVLVDHSAEELAPVGSLLPDDLGPLEVGRVVDHERAALAALDVLGSVKALCRHDPERAQWPAVVAAAQTVRVVLDDGDPMALGDREDHVHFTGDTAIVHDDNCLGPFRDGLFDEPLVDVQRVVPAVDEDRHSTTEHIRVSGRDERERRHDHFIARPEEIPHLLAALTPDLDLVYGLPAEEEHGFVRSFASRNVKAIIALGLGIADARNISAFRVFRTYLRDGFTGLDGPHASIDVALSWTTTKTGATTIHMDRRTEGRSNYSFRLLLKHAMNTMLGYSTLPLRLVGYLGLAFGILGTLLLAVVLVNFFVGTTTVQGFTTLASMVAIFSGAQMVALSVLGEYIARIHSDNMGQPTYVIRERTGTSAE